MQNIFYLGPVYFGDTEPMRANVVYDTGSTWLTVKSVMCDKCKSKIYDPANSTKSATEFVRVGQGYGSA